VSSAERGEVAEGLSLTTPAARQTWRRVELGRYFRIKHGFAFKGQFFSDCGPYVLLTPGNFREEGGLKLKGEREKYYTSSFPLEFLLRRGDLLIAMTDLKQDAPILGAQRLSRKAINSYTIRDSAR
jgi:hypothetical protein